MGSPLKSLGGFLFVACMFIGMGIGMVFNSPGIGCLIGMGIGFIVMGLLMSGLLEFKTERRIEITIKSTIVLVALVLAGIFFIGIGISLLLNIEVLMRYIGGLFSIAVGILFIVFGMCIARYREFKERT